MKKKKKIINSYIVISVILGVFIIIYGIYLLSNKNDTKSLLINKSYNIVYTSYENKEYDKQIPALNIKNISKNINEEINNFVNPYINEITNRIYYHYEINGNVLSLFITIEDFEIEGSARLYYLSYIIDLNKNKVLSKDDVYKLFDLNENYLVGVLNDKFKGYYEDEKNKKIINSNLSYEEYLKTHEITNFRDEMYCDISNGKLRIYLKYLDWPANETEYYFGSIGHVFEIE